MRPLLLAPLLLAAPALAESPFGDPVADAELADMRGGVSLPNGIDLSMAVRTETSLNGNLLLRSVYTLTDGPATLQLFAPAPDQTIKTVSPVTTGSAIDAGKLSVTFDRQNGVAIASRATSAPNVTVTMGAAPPAGDDGLSPLAIGPGGSVVTAGGVVSLEQLPAGARVRIEGDRIDVSHLTGSAFGSVIANSGSDRAIDTVTTIMLDLRGATPENLGSSLMQVEGLALDATRGLVR